MQDNQHKLQLMYILPNLFTAASAFLGIISIIASVRGYIAAGAGLDDEANGYFFKAIIYIVLSLFLDGLDGRVARLTKTTSKFVMTGTYEPSVFIGLPIPTAAIVSAFWVGLSLEYDFTRSAEWFLMFLQILLSILMVSNIRYPSFKKVDLKRADFLRILVGLTVAFSAIYICPIEAVTTLMSVYVSYGIIRYVFMRFKNKKIQKESE